MKGFSDNVAPASRHHHHPVVSSLRIGKPPARPRTSRTKFHNPTSIHFIHTHAVHYKCSIANVLVRRVRYSFRRVSSFLWTLHSAPGTIANQVPKAYSFHPYTHSVDLTFINGLVNLYSHSSPLDTSHIRMTKPAVGVKNRRWRTPQLCTDLTHFQLYLVLLVPLFYVIRI
ncbi:hypothetical protein KQX54_010181 [Cotesia glomerata]|uniref:Uncharacterized protein n=1 Tax=Cotesia glomerata TaxID=32391 RepID=A0AAV7I8T2_COTGL|nr:hypothetical protein KQX54_010181 [Cotesia glomerata]